MNKLLVAGLFLGVGLSACCNREVQTSLSEELSADKNLMSAAEIDSLDKFLYKKVLPTGVDLLFDDFMYLFSTDYDFQKQRINFPITFSSYKDSPVQIEADEWEHDNLLMGHTSYTLMFDKKSEMEIVGDSTCHAAEVEWYDMDRNELKVYSFERKNGVWMMEAIDLLSLDNLPERDFIDFYEKFVNDSLYQAKHVKNPLTFVTVDPDDDSSVLKTTLDLNQWFAFQPVLPSGFLSNIRLGKRGNKASNFKIVSIKGSGNGLSCTLFFRKGSNREWMLYKYEDVSV